MGHSGWPLVPAGLDVEVVAAGHGDISGCRFEVHCVTDDAVDPAPAGGRFDAPHGGRESRR